MNEQPTHQSTNRWKSVAIGLIFLLALMITCLTSAIWGGVIGYAVGQRSGYQTMDYDWDYAPYEEPSPSEPLLPDMPDIEGIPWLGVSFVMGPDGAQVTSVIPGSPAEDEGLEVDDIITEVDGVAVTASHPLDELILRYAPGDRVELTVLRDEREQIIRVRLATRTSEELPWLPESFPTEPPLIPDWHG